ILDVRELGRPDDRRDYAGAVQNPGECDLRRRDAARLGDGQDGVDDLGVTWKVGVLSLDRVALGALGLLVPAAPGQKSSCERAVRDDGDSLVDALRDHLPL